MLSPSTVAIQRRLLKITRGIVLTEDQKKCDKLKTVNDEGDTEHHGNQEGGISHFIKYRNHVVKSMENLL